MQLEPFQNYVVLRLFPVARPKAGLVQGVALEERPAVEAEVLDVGFDELCEDDDCPREHVTTYSGDKVHDSDVYVGDWIIVEPRVSVELEDGTRFVRQAHVVARILTEPER